MNRQVQDHAVYAAMVEAMDSAVGNVLDELRRLELEQNTVVVFTSDNGGLSTAEGSPTSNLPLRGGKGWIYEGGIRVPWIIRWPNVTPAGKVSDQPIVSHDLMPTFREIARVQEQAPSPLDGISLLDLMKGQGSTESRDLYWHYPHYSNQGGTSCSCHPFGPLETGRALRRPFARTLRSEPRSGRNRESSRLKSKKGHGTSRQAARLAPATECADASPQSRFRGSYSITNFFARSAWAPSKLFTYLFSTTHHSGIYRCNDEPKSEKSFPLPGVGKHVSTFASWHFTFPAG